MYKERAKSIFLISLIALSIFLTYQLWFGKPPLEEGVSPRYERMYFTSPPDYKEETKPSTAIVYIDEDPLLFRRGTEEMDKLWEKVKSIQNALLEKEALPETFILNEQPTEEFEEMLRFVFDPPVPPFFFSLPEDFQQLDIDNTTIEEVVLLEEGEQLFLNLKGEEHLWLELPAEEKKEIKEKIETVEGERHRRLSEHILVALEDEDSCSLYEQKEDVSPEADPVTEENGDNNEEEPIEGEKETTGLSGEEFPEDELDGENIYEIKVPQKIFVPVDEIWAAPVSIRELNIDKEQLVRAFFYDLSMARQIEERDGAQYYTDGERGLRIYSHGLMEYAAPRLEHAPGEITFNAALQQAYENLGLYGGWQQGAHLVEAERLGRSFKLKWRLFYKGLALIGEDEDEMILNEQGVTYYRRHFYELGEEISDRRHFRSYREALCQGLLEISSELEANTATLLAMEPVYYSGEKGRGENAVPAWKVHFEGFDPLYLEWTTLESIGKS